MSTSTADEQRIAAFKEATNFRSVTRNDPSVLEIIDTSVYSVIYHYDEQAGSWEKQKQEGPLFVVKRDKAPEYALYMLNRQAIKNITIPLVPGEMKATIGDATTLHLARRGEKIRRGIWFSEAGDVERFREAIIRICGEPSKKPPIPTSSSPAPVASSSATPANDGFARLFAGLQTTSTPTPPARAESSPSIPPPFTSQTSYTRHEERSVADSYGAASPPVSQPVSAIPAPPASLVPEAFVQPPGQTVDDLLNSILGVAAPPKPPQHANLPINGPSAPPTGPKASISPPMPEPHPLTSTRIGNASFAQAAGATSPIPPTTRPNLVQTASASSFGLNDQAARQSPRPFPAQAPPQHQQRNTFTPPPISNGFVPPLGHNGPPILPHTGSGPGGPRQVPHNVKGQIAQSVVEAVSARNGDEGVRRPEEVNEVGRRMFIQDLLHLIHTDYSFVEEVWRGYLARAGSRG